MKKSKKDKNMSKALPKRVQISKYYPVVNGNSVNIPCKTAQEAKKFDAEFQKNKSA